MRTVNKEITKEYILFEEKGTAHVPGARAVWVPSPHLPRRFPACSLPRRRLSYHRRPTRGSQVFVGLFSGNEHQQGMPAPCIPCLLCEAEHPKPNLSYSVFFLYNRIWSNCKCIHVLLWLLISFFCKKLSGVVFPWGQVLFSGLICTNSNE